MHVSCILCSGTRTEEQRNVEIVTPCPHKQKETSKREIRQLGRELDWAGIVLRGRGYRSRTQFNFRDPGTKADLGPKPTTNKCSFCMPLSIKNHPFYILLGIRIPCELMTASAIMTVSAYISEWTIIFVTCFWECESHTNWRPSQLDCYFLPTSAREATCVLHTPGEANSIQIEGRLSYDDTSCVPLWMKRHPFPYFYGCEVMRIGDLLSYNNSVCVPH